MSNLPKFNEQRDKIIQAYFNDEIEPNDPEFCFCGTLCDYSINWYGCTLIMHNDYAGYSGKDFVRMEKALFKPMLAVKPDFEYIDDTDFPEYEDVLFEGMCAALDELKKIHEEHGEIIDEAPTFIKRVLINK